MRLDQYLVEKGYFQSRNKARTSIDEGAIKVNGNICTKASFDVLDTDNIEVIKEVCPYVSRGGLKLKAAIDNFYLDFNGKTIVDIGSSTGGFTDCSLKHGAMLVYAIDVGTNQLDESLRKNDKVVSMENTNIKTTNNRKKNIT